MQVKTGALTLLSTLTRVATEEMARSLPDTIPALTAAMADAKRQVQVRPNPEPLGAGTPGPGAARWPPCLLDCPVWGAQPESSIVMLLPPFARFGCGGCRLASLCACAHLPEGCMLRSRTDCSSAVHQRDVSLTRLLAPLQPAVIIAVVGKLIVVAAV